MTVTYDSTKALADVISFKVSQLFSPGLSVFGDVFFDLVSLGGVG